MPWDPDRWLVDESKRIVRPHPSAIKDKRQGEIIAHTLENARDKRIFKAVTGKAWRNELFQVPGLGDLHVGIERSGSFLFGVVTFGVHCTGYVEGNDGLKIWAPRRARTKPTYGGMLDNTVAGGMAMGDDAFATLVKEASEEASLPAKLVRERVKACGTVSYFHVQAKKDGEPSGLLQPTCKYVYDLKLPAETKPHAGDDEVEGFELLTVDQIKDELVRIPVPYKVNLSSKSTCFGFGSFKHIPLPFENSTLAPRWEPLTHGSLTGTRKIQTK